MKLHAQERYPLATLVLVACERTEAQRVRLLALARRTSESREIAYGIPGIGVEL